MIKPRLNSMIETHLNSVNERLERHILFMAIQFILLNLLKE